MKKVTMVSLFSGLFVMALCLVMPLTAYSVDKLIVQDAVGTAVFVVQDTGRVGVGTGTPTAKLTVSGGFIGVDNTGQPPTVNAGFSIRNVNATFPSAVSVGGVGNPSFLANWNLETGTQFDVTKISYAFSHQVTSDRIVFQRAPAGGALATLMSIYGATGNVGIGTGASAPTSKLQVVGLPTYANNAAALAGGLTVGAFYRGCVGDAVCVVR
jgi:hypothetical protein